MINNQRDTSQHFIKSEEHGPFDIIGDVHGCYDELTELLQNLGYHRLGEGDVWKHALGRKLVFVGDILNRGPKNPETVRLVMNSVSAKTAFCVPGNQDVKVVEAIRGNRSKISADLAEALKQFANFEARFNAFSRVAVEFIDSLPSHLVLDGGKLVVAHAGLPEELQCRDSAAIREFALYGDRTGEKDEFGFSARNQWSKNYRGRAMVVYGHTPVPEPVWINHTIDIDTGCVYGGKLTALRYPELKQISVPAKAAYSNSKRPFLPNGNVAPSK